MNNQPSDHSLESVTGEQQRTYHNLSGYCFVSIDEPEVVRDSLKESLHPLQVLGTILVATEGLNVALVGTGPAIELAQELFSGDQRFKSIDFKLSLSTFSPFSKLKIKVRPEM